MTLGQNSPGKDLRTRYLYLGAAMLIGLLVLSVRLYRLQVTRGEEFAAKSVANFVREVRLRADRGGIRDRRGEVLVENRPSFDVFITPAFCERCADDVLPALALWFGWEPVQVQALATQIKVAKRNAPFQPIPVRVDITRDELDLLSAHLPELAGVEVTPVQHRSYPKGSMLAHVLGYMNEITQEELDKQNAAGASYLLGDYVGRRGVERYFEQTLRGVDGGRKEVVNARGEAIPELNNAFLGGDQVTPSQPGNNVVLSIDARLQREAEALFPGVAGASVVVDIHTGFILAIVSRPSFDPNILTGRVTASEMIKLTQDKLQPMIFRPVAQHYSPGSTFKVVTAFAALKSNAISAQSTINCPGGYKLGARTWRCHKESGHGPMNVRMALERSCDTFFYRAADVIGLDAIASVGRELGLGAATGIGVVAEVPGIMPDTAYHDRLTPGGYTKGMAINSSIGQGDDNVTPLQLTMLYATIANGGTLYQPQLVRRIESSEGRVLQEFQPKVVREVQFNPEHRRAVIEGLAAVVNEPGGTAYKYRLKDIKVAGKTGTAQVVRIGSVRLKKHQMDYFERDHVWLATFAPLDNPEIAVVTLNEHGGHGEGGESAPATMALIHKYFELKALDAGVASAQAPGSAAGLSGAGLGAPIVGGAGAPATVVGGAELGGPAALARGAGQSASGAAAPVVNAAPAGGASAGVTVPAAVGAPRVVVPSSLAPPSATPPGAAVLTAGGGAAAGRGAVAPAAGSAASAMAGVAPSPHVADVPRADAELPSRALDPSAEPGGGASAYATPPQVAPPSGTGEGLTADEGALEALPEASPGAPPLRAPEAEPLSHPVRAPDPGSPPELSPDLPLEPRAPRGR